MPSRSIPQTGLVGRVDNWGMCCEHLLMTVDVIDVLQKTRTDLTRPRGKRAGSLSILVAYWILVGLGIPCTFMMPERRCESIIHARDTCALYVEFTPMSGITPGTQNSISVRTIF